MKFFDQQSTKRRQSYFLFIGFIAAFVGTGFLIHCVIGGLSVVFGGATSILQPSTPARVLIGLFWVAIVLGAIFRSMDVKAGTENLAKRFGATRISNSSRDAREQGLLNSVAEMSIASGTPPPDVYVLRKETSINAFVLGAKPLKNQSPKHAMVITQGAMNHLDKDELKAVIAHEFGHISNDDVTLNMQLLIALGGLMAIDEVGQVLIRKNSQELVHPGMFVGYLFRLLGSIGVFFGQLLRTAFSRQREYLADACAVQFTRNPYALASALNVIKKQKTTIGLHSIHEQELAHLCFQSGQGKAWLKGFLSTHPKLQQRIVAIDPHFRIKHRKAQKAKKRGAERAMGGTASAITGTDGALLASASPLSLLTDSAQILLSDERNSIAALFAIFVCENANNRRDYFNAVAFAFNKKFAARIKEIAQILTQDIENNQLALIDQATKTLCQSVSPEQRQQLLMKLEELVSVGDEFTLKNYTSLQLIRTKLELEFPVIKTLTEDRVADGRYIKSFSSMGEEFALLLSLIVESSGASEKQQKMDFERVLKCYTTDRYSKRSKNESGIVADVSAAFQTLLVQPKTIREAFLQHCVEIVKQDGYIARAEQALIDLFAASLGCRKKLA